MSELFEKLAAIIAEPHTTVTTHDYLRAALILENIGVYENNPDYHQFVDSLDDKFKDQLTKYYKNYLP